MSKKSKIVIIGGGAAGFFAAITCAESNPNTEVIIVERGKEVLRKVKISGGGRCNVTHAIWTPRELVKNYPRGAKALMSPFSKFCTGDTVDWYSKRGVETKIEDDGRMFPVSNSSQSIVDCLWKSAKRAGVKVYTSARVEAIIAPNENNASWKIKMNRGETTLYPDKILVATGSNPKVWDMVKDLGHTIVPPVPSLFTFNIKDTRIKDLLGISMPNVEVRINDIKRSKNDRTANGSLLITHWGMSGPAILKLSAITARELHEKNYHFDITVNWRYGYSLQETLEDLEDIAQVNAKKLVRSQAQFGFPARLWVRLVAAAEIPDDRRWGEVSKKMKNKLALETSQANFQVKGKSTFKEEFVTAGGVELDEVNFQRFESKIHKNLHFAGEVLNIDAVTGGFNFQAAWTGGYLAGLALAEN